MSYQPFTVGVRVRASDCDSFGHVNNARYLDYAHEALLSVVNWNMSADPSALWWPATLAIEYHAPARIHDAMKIITWLTYADEMHLTQACRIVRTSDGLHVASTSIGWQIRDRQTSAAIALPADVWPRNHTESPSPVKAFSPPTDNGAQAFRWRHRIRHYELDSFSVVGPSICMNWLKEATFQASASSGWPIKRMLKEKFVSLQRRHDAEFFDVAHYGDEIEVTSRLIEVRRIRGTWLHEVRRADEAHTLLLRDYSTGSFVDLQGNLRAAPEGMMSTLMHGHLMHP
jgi:YbgC/YbaW family acyl-CoA thioester hydrolase